MATTFAEPGGDADFLIGTTNGFWGAIVGVPAIVTDHVHGGHGKSIKYRPGQQDICETPTGTLADAGSRLSFYVYLVALPSSSTAYLVDVRTSGGSQVFAIKITTGGVLQLWNNGTTAQIGSNGSTLATGTWYRISLAYTITSTSVNRFELFVGGVSSISVTNATLTRTGTSTAYIGNTASNASLDFRSSDHYIDNSNSLTDIASDVWVTAKRPFANGTTNGFTTQIGSGGSGYGTGHAPQVNERALSTTNGWSMVGAGSAVTEEYSLEGASVGDIDVSAATIIDLLGWASAKSLSSETASLILAGSTSSISLTSAITMFKKAAGSTTYPAGGTDIGIITTTALTTVSLYECGVLVIYTPSTNVTTTKTTTSVARITATSSQAQASKGRVTGTTTQTTSALARIRETVTWTQPSQARVTASTTRTQPALARIQESALKTVTALARIQATSTHTTSSLARVATSALRTIGSLARITESTIQTSAAKARIQNVANPTQPAIGRIQILTTHTIGAIASILITGFGSKDQPSKARITATGTQVVTALARVQSTVLKTQTSKGSMVVISVQSISSVGRLRETVSRSIGAKARILNTSFVGVMDSELFLGAGPGTDVGSQPHLGGGSVGVR